MFRTMSGFHIPTVMSSPIREFVPTKSFAFIVQSVLTCRRKSMRTWFGISQLTRTKDDGGWIIPIPTSTTGGCQISWSSFSEREKVSLLQVGQQTMQIG